ncbi:MAG TPA: SDR family NAD(P)-dependent oxidoreductase [Spirochaetia bacterium]|nr:SDR family NAD(P)-dependent oxidoreductase [Spirochaetia bacterium]
MPKVILISGGSDGLGKAIAQKLAPNNHVIILARNKEKLESVAKELNCDFVVAELADYNSLKSAIDQVIQKYQTIDILVNNAGVWMEGELEENDPQKIKELIDVNTTGTIFLTKVVLPLMRSKKTGQIVNIISQDGLFAKKSRSVYHASKWAITGFTKCLQEDLLDENIKVTGVYPGLIKTSLFEKSGVQRDLTDALDSAEVASVVEYVINLNPSTYIPEISIKNKKQQPTNMDDTNAPIIDLNIDPDMITTQNDSPQYVPHTPVAQPPVATSNVIDITPGSTDTFPPVASPPSHVDVTPPVQHQTVDVTPPVSVPTPEPAPTIISPATPSNPVIPETPLQNQSQTVSTEPTVQSSPLAEDPDLVKLIK